MSIKFYSFEAIRRRGDIENNNDNLCNITKLSSINNEKWHNLIKVYTIES